jgi:hypothetical protein
MKAEKQQKEATSRVLQQSKGGGVHIVDNRPQNMNQSKLIASISSNHVPIQMQKIVQQATDITTMRIVEDNYVLAKGEIFVTDKTIDHDNDAAVYKYTDLFFQISSEEARMVKIAREAEQKIRDKKRRAVSREKSIEDLPLEVTRRDRDPFNSINSKRIGKAHLIPNEGLAPAGIFEISIAEQLNQDSPNKGMSNLISFTGPQAKTVHQYAPGKALIITLKFRKLARAILRKRRDVRHLILIRSEEVQAKAGQYTGYARSDDEYQVRVMNQGSAEKEATIPSRFIICEDEGFPNQHDSDSDTEGLSSDEED